MVPEDVKEYGDFVAAQLKELDVPRISQPVITEDFRISANSFGVR